jgi:excinuclease ABC subunit B
MAEDLTDYFQQVGVRVRYMHADVDAIERMEIIRGLRLGEFDVLIGINLLREGLDLPEVSLVAILDADQEGFLRSDRSLIQTVGRAARHVEGRAILYADRITGSMQRAIGETNRRRELQRAHNERHGIKPRSVLKSVADIRYSTRVADARVEKEVSTVSEEPSPYVTGESIEETIERMEQEMRKAAAELDFENAARLRDQLFEFKAARSGARPAGAGGRRWSQFAKRSDK